MFERSALSTNQPFQIQSDGNNLINNYLGKVFNESTHSKNYALNQSKSSSYTPKYSKDNNYRGSPQNEESIVEETHEEEEESKDV